MPVKNIMNDFIDKLQADYDIQILPKSQKGNNTFDVDRDGNITSLYLNKVKLKNLNALLPVSESIIDLSIINSSIKNIDLLKHFPRLKKLNLGFNTLLLHKAFDNLKFLPNLLDLDLSGTGLENSNLLGSLINLKRLKLNGIEELYDVKGLENLSSLTHFELTFNEVKDIKKINLHKNIQSLDLSVNAIDQISGLERFPNLVELNLSANSIPKIQGLKHLRNLKRFILASTWIEKIEGLDNLINLEVLDLSNNEISKIQGLDNLLKLKRLNLSRSKLTKVENLDQLINLEDMLLGGNEISAFDTTFLKKLKSPCIISLGDYPKEKLSSFVPDKIQFDDYRGLPRRFGFAPYDVLNEKNELNPNPFQ